jgi:hypothetical protein
MVADSRNFDEEQSLDPHESEKLDPDVRIEVLRIRNPGNFFK